MGLFSFLGKNKQEAAAEDDSAYHSRDEDASLAARARSKRPSSAGEPGSKRGKSGRNAPDPILPEKKRARRRLVGAIALALLVAIGLPMLLDSEPKPLASDIAIQIPSKDKPTPQSNAAPAPVWPLNVAASASLDQKESIVDPSRIDAAKPDAAAKPEPAKADAKADGAKADAKSDGAKADAADAAAKSAAKTLAAAPVATVDAKADAAKPAKSAEAKDSAKTAKADDKPAKADDKAGAKAVAKSDDKPAAAKTVAKAEDKTAAKPAKADDNGDAARALAILEGKQVGADGQKYVLKVAAFASQSKVDELTGKLKEAGIKYFTQKVPTESGDMTRVRAGPFASKEEADKAAAKLKKLGLNGTLVTS